MCLGLGVLVKEGARHPARRLTAATLTAARSRPARHVSDAVEWDVGFDPLLLEACNLFPVHIAVFRRAATARLDPGLPATEDWDFWLRLTREHGYRFACLPEPTVVYHRIHQSGSMIGAVAASASAMADFSALVRRIWSRWPTTTARSARFWLYTGIMYWQVLCTLAAGRPPDRTTTCTRLPALGPRDRPRMARSWLGGRADSPDRRGDQRNRGTQWRRPVTRTPRDLAAADLGGAVPSEVLRANGKSVLALGYRDGLAVVIKALRTGEEFWRAKFAREIAVYLAFAVSPPSARVPRLLHTDGHSVLVIEQIPGHPLSGDRYPARPLDGPAVGAAMSALTSFGRWNPPPGVLTPVFDYPDRIERYHRGGFLDAGDRAALDSLLKETAPPSQAAHGDPLPSNLILTRPGGSCALVDFEFTGMFLPGFDLAMLHAVLAGTPGTQDAIEALVAQAGIEVPFLINQAMVLTREMRIHAELPDCELRACRLALLEPQWQAFRQHLHARR
jgi:hypothetical protein